MQAHSAKHIYAGTLSKAYIYIYLYAGPMSKQFAIGITMMFLQLYNFQIHNARGKSHVQRWEVIDEILWKSVLANFTHTSHIYVVWKKGENKLILRHQQFWPYVTMGAHCALGFSCYKVTSLRHVPGSNLPWNDKVDWIFIVCHDLQCKTL